MTGPLSDAGLVIYEELTTRTFLVVDVEFTTDDEGEHHLISIAIVPVVGGQRARASSGLYFVMNPGVPIDEATAAVHRFRDADVAGKHGFDHFAPVIAERLREEGAVMVCHTTIDAHVLLEEFDRLGARDGGAGLPLMPVLDTQRLVAAAGYPDVTKGSYISLDRLCDVARVARPKRAHDAREDARASANALIAILRHVATQRVFWSLDGLLEEASGGTTLEPRGPSHLRTRRFLRSALPPEHIARHLQPLLEPVAGGSEAAERWLDTAAECAQLRCPYLRDEARVAASANGAVLLRPLMDDLPHLGEPGQAGTLLGAVRELLVGSDPTRPTLPAARALRWWKPAWAAIAKSTPCDRSDADTSCPSCQEGAPCPRDVVFLALAEIVTLGGRGVMDNGRVRDLLFSSKSSYLNLWRTSHPDVLGYALWRVARFQFGAEHDEAAFMAVDLGISLGVHRIDPRLVELACERLVGNGDPDEAFRVAAVVLAQRTTDPAYADLDEWVMFTQNALYAQQAKPRKAITHPRRAWPDGHVNPRQYS